jgi:hypothetical protein
MHHQDLVTSILHTVMRGAIYRSLWRLPLPVTIFLGIGAALLLYRRGDQR